MKLKITFLFSLFFVFNLVSVPYHFNRLYNPKTRACVDLISDIHDENLDIVQVSKFMAKTQEAQQNAELLASLYRNLGGDVKFLWECSEIEASLMKVNSREPDVNLDKLIRLILNDAENFTKNVVPHLPIGRELAECKLGLTGSALDEFMRLYDTFTQKFEPGFRYPDYTFKRMYPGYPVAIDVDKPFKDIVFYICQKTIQSHLMCLARDVSNKIPQANFIPSDTVRDRDFALKHTDLLLMAFKNLLYQGIIQAEDESEFKNLRCSFLTILFEPILVKLLISLLDIFYSETKLDHIERIIGQQYPKFSEYLQKYKRDLICKTNGEIMLNISHIFSANHEPVFLFLINYEQFMCKYLDNIMEIIKAMTALTTTPVDLEFLGNILSCDKNRMVVYAGGRHCQNLCNMLEEFEFVPVSNVGEQFNIDEKQDTLEDIRWPSPLDLATLESLLFEDPKITFAKHSQK